MVGDRPPHQTSREAIDHRVQLEESAVSAGRIRDATNVSGVRYGCGEITVEQVLGRSVGWFSNGSAVPTVQTQALDVVLAHNRCDRFVFDSLAGGSARMDLGGDPGPPVGAVYFVDSVDLLGEFDVGSGAGSPHAGR